MVSLPWMDSCPSHFHESGFFFGFEAVRTATASGVAAMASRATPLTRPRRAGEELGTPRRRRRGCPRVSAPRESRAATASVPRRYALPWFKALFATGVGRAPASNDVEQRLENLNVFFTYFVYTNALTRRQKST